jgi:hypothetical protein
MPPDNLDEKLQKIERLAEEDHKMIKSLYVRARIATGLRILYWAIIIVVVVGSYYFVLPYVEEFKKFYSSFEQAKGAINNSAFGDFFGDFKENFKAPTSTPQR